MWDQAYVSNWKENQVGLWVCFIDGQDPGSDGITHSQGRALIKTEEAEMDD